MNDEFEGFEDQKPIKFDDVKESDWYKSAVGRATSIGVVGGYNSGLFGPHEKITREQMALMMRQYAKYKGNEIIGGKSGNKLAPQGKATRAECATIMMKIMKQFEE